MDRPLKSFLKFFICQIADDGSDLHRNSFAMTLTQEGQTLLPLNSHLPFQLTPVCDGTFEHLRMKITQEVSDFIINRDEQVTESKDIPVSHFLIDMRPAVLQQNLAGFRQQTFGHQEQELYKICEDGEALSIYELCMLFEEINSKWGNRVED